MYQYSVEDLMNVIRKSMTGNSYSGTDSSKQGQTDRDMTNDVLALLKAKGSITMHDLRRIQEEYDHNDITPGFSDNVFANKLNEAYKRERAGTGGIGNVSGKITGRAGTIAGTGETGTGETGNTGNTSNTEPQKPNPPDNMTEKPDNSAQTGKQVANTNAGVAGANPGDWIIRSNGQKYVLTAEDIAWAKGKSSSTQTTASQHNAERKKDQGSNYNGGDESPDTSNMDANVTSTGTALSGGDNAKPIAMGIGSNRRYFVGGQEVDKATYKQALAEWKAARAAADPNPAQTAGPIAFGTGPDRRYYVNGKEVDEATYRQALMRQAGGR